MKDKYLELMKSQGYKCHIEDNVFIFDESFTRRDECFSKLLEMGYVGSYGLHSPRERTREVQYEETV